MLLTRSSTPVRAGRSEEILGSPMSVARPFRLATAFEQHSIPDGSIPSISVSNCQGRSNARDNTALWTLYRDAASPYSDTSPEEKSCDVLPSLGSPLTTGPLQEDKDGLSRNLLTPKIVSGNELVTNDTSSNCKDALCKETESKSSVNDTLLRSEDPYTPVKIPKHPVLQVLHNSEMSINQPFMSWTQRSRMLSVPFNAPTRQFLQAPNDIGSMLASSRHPRGQTEPPSCRESKTSIPSGHFATRPSTSMEFGSFISKQNWPTLRNAVSATSHESNSRISSMVRLDALFRYVPVSAAISRTPEKLRARRQSQSRVSPPPLTASVSIPLPGQQQMSSSDETLSLEDASKPVTPLQSPVRFHTAVRHVGSPVSEQRAYGIEIPSPGAYSKVSNEETVLEKFGKDRRGSRLAIWRWWAATESSRPLDIEAGRSFVHRDSEADHETLYGKLKKFLNAGPFAA
ncbi:hypothetical protein BJ138DRAFT_1147062 [Hygrophoropsis aurantiaca]|uniref:Uncharacterized protein n=1 Tax=Hygrophoropsis aurantiaca TaxID=72124 RepID=A0ACB8AIP7_9AGAM|nr:hypothetical protein BJ138DRAFT_1147062 [Hygrophoropsis aurantiaca]